MFGLPIHNAALIPPLGAWKRALEEGGMNEYGIRKQKPLSDVRPLFVLASY